MHHLVFGINFQIHFVSLTILVLIHLLIHLSTHPCHHRHSRHLSLLHSFTPDSKPTFQQILSTLIFLLFTHWTAFVIMGLDWTYHAHQFIFSFSFKFFCSFHGHPSAFYYTLNTHYHIMSHRISNCVVYGTYNIYIKARL